MAADKARRLVLVVPGLCGPVLDTSPGELLSVATPALDVLVSRSRTATAPRTLAATLTGLLPLAPDPGASLAVAALTWLADTGEYPDRYLLRADPVHVRADQACLRLFDTATFSLGAEEAAALVATFNEYYRKEGWQLRAPNPQRWYLVPPRALDPGTREPGEIGGQDIREYLPSGPDSRTWRTLLNEVQMLFHDHPVNVARQARGEPPVNSIWPWGGGVLPGRAEAAAVRVVGDDPLLVGLSRLAGCERHDLPVAATELPESAAKGTCVVLLDVLAGAARYGDVEAWIDGIEALEQDWFAPVRERLASRALDTLEIYPVNGRCHRLDQRRLRYLWKRPRPFTRLCAHD